ncbi:MAG TPA: hypothetical protein VK843_06940 [Planctomycetota bacterium]|nr:hypothetical protein [Planctomycetota bacterium]
MILLRDAVSAARSQYAEHPHSLASALAGPFLGPFLGGYANAWEHCPPEHVHRIEPISSLVLLMGIAMQFSPLPAGRGWGRTRLTAWTVGWTVWFAAGLASLAHVLG